MKTPDQKKERDALIEALRVQDSCINDIDGLEDKFISKHKRTSTDFLWNIAQSYADHFEEIQALKSGEWVLMPIEITKEMRKAAWEDQYMYVGGSVNDAELLAQKRTNNKEQQQMDESVYKAMVAARPNVKENDDE